MTPISAATQSDRIPLRLYLFGSFRVERDTQTIHLPTRKVESLLAYLVLHPEPHAREKLAALLWGDSTDELARRSLRTALSSVRQSLGDDVVLADRETVQLNPDFSIWVDAREISDFRFQIADLGSSQSTIENLQSEIDLYRGDLLAEFYDDWILPERERLRAIYIDALLQLTQHRRAKSEYTRAIEFAQKILATDSANEKAYQHIIFCLVATGDRIGALKQYDECAKKLRDELGVEPSQETIALRNRIEQDLFGSKSREALLTNLPHPLTSFIGREKEISEVKHLLTQHRLVTLTGSGGCGKTRLAIEVAGELVESFRQGVWWVDLAPLSDASHVPQAIAQSLGVREAANQSLQETLVNVIRDKHLLLVLDNCEHLITACAGLADKLLSACIELKIFATSRESLGITGEVAWRVPSFAVPDVEQFPSLEQLMQYDVIQLFVQRAMAVVPQWRLNGNAPSVARMCARLDGIPLAIELAAVRVKVLSVEQIAARLDDRFNLLTMGSRAALARQQTLRATIDWSYDLLSDAERILLQRLSVFAGGWTLEAAESVCSDQYAVISERHSPAENWIPNTSILDLLSHLVNKSLVLAGEVNGETRYRMLETIRQYTREKLDASNQSVLVRNRHLEFFAKYVEEAEPKLRGREQMLWYRRLDAELDNIRAALQWAMDNSDVDTGLTLAGSWHWYCAFRGYAAEGRRWCERLLARGTSASKPAQAVAWKGYGLLAWMQGDHSRAELASEKSLALYRELGDKSNIGKLLFYCALPPAFNERWDKAKSLLEESLALRREIGDKWGMAHVYHQLAFHALAEEDYADANEMYAKALALFREVGDGHWVARTLSYLGMIARKQGDVEAAIAFLTESTTFLFEMRDKWSLCGSLEAGWAPLATLQGNPIRAARLFGAVEALRESIATPHLSKHRLGYDAQVASVRGQLDEATFVAAWNEGRAMSFEQTIEYALQIE
ncbi:MAG: tetratricopeptide repeat protein [Chloroflexi bacterium]|nr:tetratricopeptide repeat protein [Chloroflexota bacterium]